MSTAELPCYTLINVLSDSEALSEQKLAEDLGKLIKRCKFLAKSAWKSENPLIMKANVKRYPFQKSITHGVISCVKTYTDETKWNSHLYTVERLNRFVVYENSFYCIHVEWPRKLSSSVAWLHYSESISFSNILTALMDTLILVHMSQCFQ